MINRFISKDVPETTTHVRLLYELFKTINEYSVRLLWILALKF